MNQPPEPPSGPPPGASSTPPPPTPPPGGSSQPGGPSGQSPNRGLMLVLAYLWPLALVPLLLEKEDEEVQWHAKHGLVLFAAELAISIVAWIFFGILAFVDLGCSGCIFSWLFTLAVIVLHIVCIVKALNGQKLLIPGVSELVERF